MKKIILISLLVLGVSAILLGAGFFLLKKTVQKPVSPVSPTPTPEGVLIETKLEERPFISIIPSSDGYWLTLEISQIKNADILEYELSYNTDKGNQGSIGNLELEGKTFYSKKILLGTESSGHYKYDQGVTGGSLVIRLRKNNEVRKFITDFRLQKGGQELSSLDNQFKIKAKLPVGVYFVIMPTVGLPASPVGGPGQVENKVLSQPYGVFSTATQPIKPIEVIFTPEDQETNFQLYFWDGKTWLMKLTSVVGTFIALTAE